VSRVVRAVVLQTGGWGLGMGDQWPRCEKVAILVFDRCCSFSRLRLDSAMVFHISITDEADAQLHALSARVLLIVGRKVGNKLIVGGREFHGHRGDTPESTSDGHAGPAGEVL
jgi:hypothetical protein